MLLVVKIELDEHLEHYLFNILDKTEAIVPKNSLKSHLYQILCFSIVHNNIFIIDEECELIS